MIKALCAILIYAITIPAMAYSETTSQDIDNFAAQSINQSQLQVQEANKKSHVITGFGITEKIVIGAVGLTAMYLGTKDIMELTGPSIFCGFPMVATGLIVTFIAIKF